MTRLNPLTISLSLTLLLLLCRPAHAAPAAPATKTSTVSKAAKKTDQKSAKAKAKKPPKRKNGWYPKLTAGVATALAHNYQIPGVENGLTFNLTALISGKLTLVHNQLRWITALNVVNGHSKTPLLKPILKTADLLELDSRVVYRLSGKMDKVFLYGGLVFTAPMFAGDLVPVTDTDLSLTRTDGSELTAVARADRRFRLTPAFAPLFFKQLVGSGAKAYQSALATLGLYIGITSQQIWASGWTPADEKTTPELELVALRNYQQIGVATGFTLGGRVHKRLTYSLLADFTYPLYTSIETGLKGFDLMDIDFSFKLSLKIARWVSVDYLLSAKRLPLIVDQWQLTNNLVIAITADVM